MDVVGMDDKERIKFFTSLVGVGKRHQHLILINQTVNNLLHDMFLLSHLLLAGDIIDLLLQVPVDDVRPFRCVVTVARFSSWLVISSICSSRYQLMTSDLLGVWSPSPDSPSRTSSFFLMKSISMKLIFLYLSYVSLRENRATVTTHLKGLTSSTGTW